MPSVWMPRIRPTLPVEMISCSRSSERTLSSSVSELQRSESSSCKFSMRRTLSPMTSVNAGWICGMALRQRLKATKLLAVLPSDLERSPGVAAPRAAGGGIGTLLSFYDLLALVLPTRRRRVGPGLLLKRFPLSFDRASKVHHPIVQYIYQLRSRNAENTWSIFLVFYVTPRA